MESQSITDELLAALKQFVEDHEASGFFCAGLNAAFMRAKAAIAKAEGRQA